MTERVTPNMLQMLAAVVAAGSYKLAAYRLGRSESTVRNTMHLLREALDVDSTPQAVWLLRDELRPLLEGRERA